MVGKKYILTEETKVHDGCILHRIQAIKDFGAVKAGDLGGWIEKEENLSHKGNAWVGDDAYVFGNARVSGNAYVFKHAHVYGYAQVFDQARVFDDARVFGSARVCEHARICNNARVGGGTVSLAARLKVNAYVQSTNDYLIIGHIGSRQDNVTFYKTETDGIWVSCGCFNNSLDAFSKAVAKTHRQGMYAVRYQHAIDLAKVMLRD